jgi:hypothetical protein
MKNSEGFFCLLGGMDSCIYLYQYIFTDLITNIDDLYNRFPYFSKVFHDSYDGYDGSWTANNPSNDDHICDDCFKEMVLYHEVRFWGWNHLGKDGDDWEGNIPAVYPYPTECCGTLIVNEHDKVYKLWMKDSFPYDKCYMLTTGDYNHSVSCVWYPRKKEVWMKDRAMICSNCISVWDMKHAIRKLGSYKSYTEYDVPIEYFRYELKAQMWKQFHKRQLKILSQTCILLPKDVQSLILFHLMKVMPLPLSERARREYIKSTLLFKKNKFMPIYSDGTEMIYNRNLRVCLYREILRNNEKEVYYGDVKELYHRDLYENKVFHKGHWFSTKPTGFNETNHIKFYKNYTQEK